MSPQPRHPYVDALSMSGEEAHVYEVIATLEGTGRPVNRAEIAAIAGLDDQALDTSLSRLTGRQVLVRTQQQGEPGYELARREWRAAPDDQ